MMSMRENKPSEINPKLLNFIDANIREELVNIDVFRKKVLQGIADYLALQISNNETANALFICTHNSRRSHLSQIWAQTAAFYFEIENFKAYSGGTEVTAFFPSAIETLLNSGFELNENSTFKNPHYKLYFSKNNEPIIAFSKLYNDKKYNPTHKFCAVLTCSGAEKNCPVVYGADRRFALHYEDPKISDGTPFQKQVYAERSKQIAIEMFYLMAVLKRKVKS